MRICVKKQMNLNGIGGGFCGVVPFNRTVFFNCSSLSMNAFSEGESSQKLSSPRKLSLRIDLKLRIVVLAVAAGLLITATDALRVTFSDKNRQKRGGEMRHGQFNMRTRVYSLTFRGESNAIPLPNLAFFNHSDVFEFHA